MVYSISAWLSLAVINGIVSFMLTPGDWLVTGSFWDGWLNPGYWPSLLARTAASLALAGLWGLMTATFLAPEEQRRQAVRYASYWLMPAFFALPAASLWFPAAAPAAARNLVMGGAAPITLMFGFSLVVSVLIFFFSRFGAFARPPVSPAVAAVVLALGLVATGGTEWVREGMRKPYIIYDHMYSNGVYVRDVPRLTDSSILAEARCSLTHAVDPANPATAGREVFRVECMSCHPTDGYNAIRPLVRGWDQEMITLQLTHLDRLKGFMPPFLGTAAERDALAAYLAGLNEGGR